VRSQALSCTSLSPAMLAQWVQQKKRSSDSTLWLTT
jgi:hypothetical protein